MANHQIDREFDTSASDCDIIDFCKQSPSIHESELGSRVVRIAKNSVVKIGMNVTAGEAANQAFVSEHADPSILVVPRVLRYFEDKSSRLGYLVMEYIDGTVVEMLDADQRLKLIAPIANAITHLQHLPLPPNQPPGPLGGGLARGYVWSDDGISAPFESVCQFEAFINDCVRHLSQRQLQNHPTPLMTFHDDPLIMCHTDLNPRNIICVGDGRICFLDWSFGGVYPKIFETYSLAARVNWESPPHFREILMQLGITEPWSDQRLITLNKLCHYLTSHMQLVPYNTRNIRMSLIAEFI